MTTYIQVDIRIQNDKFVIRVVPFINVVAALTTTQFLGQRFEFRCEDYVYLLVAYISSERADELFRGVTSVHVQGEYAAVMVADGAGQTMQLYRVVIPDGTIESQGCFDGTNNGGDPVRVKIEGTGGIGFEMSCQPV